MRHVWWKGKVTHPYMKMYLSGTITLTKQFIVERFSDTCISKIFKGGIVLQSNVNSHITPQVIHFKKITR